MMSFKFMAVLFIGLMTTVSLAGSQKELPVEVGDEAPSIKLKDHNGEYRSLSEFEGKKVVLYFYPKDDTPGCTAEACSFRDGYSELQEAGIVILGVSYDSPKSHKKFKEKYNLPFTLLSDENKEAAKAYGAYRPGAAKRYTFLINEAGKIIHIFKEVDVNEHADEVLAIFEQKKKKS